MMAAFTWIITFISLAGTVLNVRKNILCFYLWAVGNVAWLAFDVASGLFSRAVLDTVHLAFATFILKKMISAIRINDSYRHQY